MQTRFSTCRGMEVVEENNGKLVGLISNMLIDPDSGKILGFYIFVNSGFFFGGEKFVSSIDVLNIGTRFIIRDVDVICDPNDIIRLQPILKDSRSVLKQRIVSESGRYLGKCADVQFDTKSFIVQWLFPKKLYKWMVSIPVSAILEIKPKMILVKNIDSAKSLAEEEGQSIFCSRTKVPDVSI